MVDDIIVMLEEHMPSRGYTPTSAIYLLLLDALYKQKRYTEAVQLFHFTLKDDSARNSKRNEKDSSVTVRYEFFSDKNFQVALQCCAAGKC